MKTLHYVAHIALLTTFVVGSVCLGFYINGSQESRSAILSIFKKDVHEHNHAPDAIVAQAGNCKLCKELGISGCTAAVPLHLRSSASQRVAPQLTNTKADGAKDVTLKDAVAAWINSFIPEKARKDASDHLEPEVLMTYAAWD